MSSLGFAFGVALSTLAQLHQFSVDSTSPIVVAHGKSASDIFANPPGAPGGPPPDAFCREHLDLGVPKTANVDAISQVNGFLIDAPGIYPNGADGYMGNIYAWSIDRASVGQDGGSVLEGICIVLAADIPSVGSPELDETSSGDSACGDVFVQLFEYDPLTGLCVRINFLQEEEADMEETSGSFGAPGLDELDGLALFCKSKPWYFSVDPPTAAALGVTPATILVAAPPFGSFEEFMAPDALGLTALDDIDALQLGPGGLIAFSLAPGSPSLGSGAAAFSAADIFLVDANVLFPGYVTPGADCWINAEYLSLVPTDNVDGLWIQVGDPGSKRLRIMTDGIPVARLFLPYDAPLVALGGEKPYSWELVAGRLPMGIVLDPARGVLQGIAQELGDFQIRVRVRDRAGSTNDKNFLLRSRR